MIFSVGGRSANTAATAGHVAAALWNPHATKLLRLKEIWVYKTVGTADNHRLSKITTRGTPGSTVTPDADNCWSPNKIAPPSGALLDLAAYSVQPTVESPGLANANLPGTVGSGFIWTFDSPYYVEPGTGISVNTPQAVILQASDFTFIWEERETWEPR